MGQGLQYGVTNRYTSAASEQVSLVSGILPWKQGATVVAFMVLNGNGATRYIQVFDGYAAPAGGAVPLISLSATSAQTVSFGVPDAPLLMVNNGIVIVSSTTSSTYTAGSSDMFVTCFWVTGKLYG